MADEIVKRKGPWKICIQEAAYITRNIFGPILAIGGKLSEYPNKVKSARKIAELDHQDHKYDDFACGGGRAANPKRKKS